ncbi:MAG: HAMP domain-containing histidine kinase [Muribaculaceae bacterium]|nr:HAMP domain-containing histidine kinase [Muribaculaceae bacterium]
MNIYDIRRYGTYLFLLLSAAVIGAFLYFSGSLVKDLGIQERARMQIWADATREIARTTDFENANIDFLLSIIEANNNIPVLLTDAKGNILQQRNYSLPEPENSLDSEANRQFLAEKLKSLSHSDNNIVIVIAPGVEQHLYYEDSTLLRHLSIYPYIQLAVMAVFVLIVYFAVSSTKRAEQNKVWVGLSKETAHQLGTPISSLMAWIEMLRSSPGPINTEVLDEMDKDLHRLETIASRFSKIGSRPNMEYTDLNELISKSVSYMRGRISSHIDLTLHLPDTTLFANVSTPLIEWVMENLIKNAVDAMEARGAITISLRADHLARLAIIEVADTGKGMSRKMRKQVFNPGFTTKKRGWGLGLTLARRIVEQYHGGKIIVSDSQPGVGTTFRITLPLCA